MSATSYTPRLGLPQYIGTDTFDPLHEVNAGNRDADHKAARTVDAFIPCTATYSSPQKQFELTPTQAGLALPTVFTVRFIAPADFSAGDKLMLGGVVYTPAYTDGSGAVAAGAWMSGAAVGLALHTPSTRAFIGQSGRNLPIDGGDFTDAPASPVAVHNASPYAHQTILAYGGTLEEHMVDTQAHGDLILDGNVSG